MYKIKPIAYVKISGGPLAPNINGYAYFYNAAGGTEVLIEVLGYQHINQQQMEILP